MSNAFLSRMPAGIPGDVSRKEGAVIEALQYDSTNPPSAYGVPAVIDASSHFARKLLAGDAPASIYGIFVRPYPTSNINTTDGLGTSTVNTNDVANIAKKAYMTVLLQNSTAAVKGGQVYARTAATSGNLKQGGIEAASAGSASAAAKSGGNTGNGTCTSVAAGANAQPGVYKVRCTAAGTNLATFNLVDPSGNEVEVEGLSGSGGTAVFGNTQVGFTITDGSSDFVVGDGFDITVTTTNIAVPNATFMGPADANGNVEIAFRM